MSKTTAGFMPNIAIPPGETLREYLDAKQMTQVDLAKRVGLTTKTINEIVKGKAPITAETAIKLEAVFSTPASFWNNLEAQYQETKARLSEESKIEDEQGIAALVPYAELVKDGHVPPTRKMAEKVVHLRSFFGVASLHYLPDVHPVAFRKEKETSSSYALAAWLRIGEIAAEEIATEAFSEKKLKSIVPKLKELTKKNPDVFLEELVQLCASCGIAIVFARHLPKTYAHGATKWLSPDKALIQLSIRRAYADIFWFSFFHELGHILLHGKKRVFAEIEGVRGELESEADLFATEQLIPSGLYQDFLQKGEINTDSITNFAMRAGVHPCIVVGRLQHDKVIGFNKYNEMRPKFCWRK
jgi:HTH-type transcriptional regulator/antitoxin HigA